MTTLDSIMYTTSEYINENIQSIEHKQSVLEKLIKIDKQLATVKAMDMLMAGVDRSSSTFSALLLCLAKNPDKQNKLREEVLTILRFKDSEFTEESIKNMPYLRACTLESLRIYPPIIGNTRVPANDVVLSGCRIPKGTQVTMVLTTLVNDDAYYIRSIEYLPERWLKRENIAENQNPAQCPYNSKPSSPFVLMPFGFGPRTCVGRRLVEMKLELGIARFIKHFQIEYKYPTENAFESLLINTPHIPLTFKFTDKEN